MKLCLIFTFIGVMQISAATYSQDVKLDLKVKNASLESVMNSIRTQSEYSFFFDDVAVKKISNITLDLKGASIEEVLTTCLQGTGFGFRVLDKTIILFKEQAKDDKKKTYLIEGKVLDEKNLPMPGVTVMLDSTTVGTSTDTAGRFVLPLPRPKGTLVFSFIGFKTQKVKYTADKKIVVKMQEDISGLDEVQVVAYGSQKKRTLVSSISTLKADEMKELPTHSLESLLQGHMAGVEVNNLSGAPGGGGSIVAIRGYNSFFVDGEGADRNYGTPLYVIDGVPMQAFTSPITGTNTLSDLDPSMIESIEVLKDAASAAIYGSRAGNGVILITTKKGRAGKAQFTANASYSVSWLPEAPDHSGGNLVRYYNLNALRNTVTPYDNNKGEWIFPTSYEEVYKYKKDSDYPTYNYFFGNRLNAGSAHALQDSLSEFYNNSTDWWRYSFRTAKVYNANLQASGGSETMHYMIGAGYYKEEGIMLSSGFERVNVITNLEANPTKRLKINNQISLTYSDRSRGGKGKAGEKIEGISVDLQKQSSLLPGSDYIKKYMLNDLNSMIEKNQSYSLRYNLVLDYNIMRGLNLRMSGGIDYNQQNQNNFEPSTLDKNFHSSVTKGTITKNISILNENLLTYDFKIKQDHNFNIMLGLSFQKDQTYSNQGQATGGPNDFVHYASGQWGGINGLNYVGAAGTHETDAEYYKSAFDYKSSLEEERMNSYFGRFRYNYKEKYMFEATIRRDGSSVFGEDVRWATFPSIAAGWAFTDESFMKPLYWLSFGKIRASWGRSGQKFSQPYLAHGLISSSSDMFLGNQGMQPDLEGGLLNKKLSWEKTDQYDIGLDISLLDYRFKFTLDYYYRNTKGQLQKINLPGDLNYQAFQWQNALAVSNEGLELELTADIFRETAVKWRMKLNASRNWNRFKKSSDGFDFGENIIGKALYNIKTFKTDGFYNSMDEVPIYAQPWGLPKPLSTLKGGIFIPGSRKILDLDNNGIIIPSGDMYFAASPLPLAHGGFINEIKWKQFDVNIFFTYSLGRHILKVYDDKELEPGEFGSALNLDIRGIDAWTSPDSKNPDYPLIIKHKVQQQYDGLYDCDIENVHMLRLKQLTLGYNLHERFAKKLGLTGARVFITGENLFLLTNYSGLDPEIVNLTTGLDKLESYPLPRKFTIGLSVNF